MEAKRLGRASGAVLLALATVAGVGFPDPASGAPMPPFPQTPCLGITAAGTCHGLEVEDDEVRPSGSGNNNGNNNPSPNDQGGGGNDQPSPAELRRQAQRRAERELLLRADTYLLQPTVVTNPGQGNPSIIDVPTFFEVTNWQGQQVDHYENEEFGISVTITATPTLSLDPGEPGARTIPCEDGGTRFDPNGPSPREQAARPGACAHTYTRRTGVSGRPDHWEAELIISWTLDWDMNFTPPADITIPTSDVLTETVEREVDEVQTVVNS